MRFILAVEDEQESGQELSTHHVVQHVDVVGNYVLVYVCTVQYSTVQQ